jgi:hypothetical protein
MAKYMQKQMNGSSFNTKGKIEDFSIYSDCN